MIRLLAAAWLALVPGLVSAQTQTPPPAPASAPKPPHIVLVGDSTVTEGSGWGLGFRELVAGARVTNTAQNGRSSKSFRDEGHWDTAIALHGDYYLIQFGHNDQPGKGPERETDPASTFPANLARYVDDVRAIGATPILVTSLVRRTFREAEPAKLTSTLGPWVEAVKRVAAEKRVPIVDLDASSRALCERLGPAATHRFDLTKDDGTFDTTHLDAAGSAVFARLVVDELRRVVPALAPIFTADPAAAALSEEPPDLPAPLPLLGVPDREGRRALVFGRVYTRSLRLARFQRREAYNGREPDLGTLPAVATSPAILVAWDYVPMRSLEGMTDCGFEPAAPRRIRIRPNEPAPREPPGLQPLAVLSDPAQIRQLLGPFESDLARIQWVAVLDPSRLQAGTLLMWTATHPCPLGSSRPTVSETAALIAADDVQRWRRP